ncbi:hypothetical protein BKA70DRAFT_1430564 [Coprinopsis sp. MPI-PUGE-AT-0042]|nr:hypothetical protein BKA70DRAFT_1430564 [Coprinopsis sp. MPI-PUGE-AT-0042]
MEKAKLSMEADIRAMASNNAPRRKPKLKVPDNIVDEWVDGLLKGPELTNSNEVEWTGYPHATMQDPIVVYDDSTAHTRVPFTHATRQGCRGDEKWIDLVKEDYIDGLARHIHGETSWIKVFSSEEWKGLDPDEKCRHLARYILLYVKPPQGEVTEPTLLDAAKRVACSSLPVTASDFSLPPNDDMSKRQVKTTLDVVAQQAALHDKGKVMTATDGERLGSLEIAPYTSCVSATVATKDCVGMGTQNNIPSGGLWFLMSGAWSRSDGHVDAGGGHTVVEMLRGTKYWMVKVPDVDSNSEEADEKAWKALGNTKSHLDENKDSESMEGYRWEGLEIQPGSILFMKPHTWHAAITTQASFANGYHFWNSRTLLGTLVNEIACSLGGAFLTNSSHPSLRANVHRILLLHFEALVRKRNFKVFQNLNTTFSTPTSPKDLPHLLALLFLVLLDDLFNPEIFENARAKTATTPRQGRGYQWSSFADEQHPIVTAMDFQAAFYRLFGEQLHVIKCLRTNFIKNNLFRPDDQDTAQEKNTETLENELKMASVQARQVEDALLQKG